MDKKKKRWMNECKKQIDTKKKREFRNRPEGYPLAPSSYADADAEWLLGWFEIATAEGLQ